MDLDRRKGTGRTTLRAREVRGAARRKKLHQRDFRI